MIFVDSVVNTLNDRANYLLIYQKSKSFMRLNIFSKIRPNFFHEMKKIKKKKRDNDSISLKYLYFPLD